ncbi:MAG: indole-3-glycerol phosphate synthase TrpC [Planctomycetaceae bacterium]|jgi:indole-3-glycerol phosphate synthase|nr:indole-3-glycerol phosphate synthase TrpC [Planctomycetaceae bacterium]
MNCGKSLNHQALMTLLDQITEQRKLDIAAKTVPISELQQRYKERSDFRPFRQALQAKQTGIIAEIKRGSPARGLFAPDLNPAVLAAEYETGGAACVSVLTEEKFFFGSVDFLIAARKNCLLPVLQKDFIVSEYQIYEAALVADAVLLIARCLKTAQLRDYRQLAAELKLDALVEVFDEEDVKKIEPFHFPLVGINNRNLATMGINLNNAKRFFDAFDETQTVVAASGIQGRADIETLKQAGFRNFLIGEYLSKNENRVALLKELF